jgi:hypothetical protein
MYDAGTPWNLRYIEPAPPPVSICLDEVDAPPPPPLPPIAGSGPRADSPQLKHFSVGMMTPPARVPAGM